MHLVRLGLLVVALGGVIGAAPPRTFVVLPIEGAVLPSVRSAADEALRDALLPYGDVQSRADTALILDDAAKGGLTCPLDQVDCMLRVGAIAGATHVMRTRLKGGNALRAEIDLIDVDVGRATTVRGSFIIGDGGQSARALVMRALSGKSDPPEAPPPQPQPSVEPPVEEPPGDDDGLPPMVLAGGVTAIAGALIAVGAGVGVAMIEAQLSQPREGPDPISEHTAELTTGRVLLGASVLGVVVAAAGGALVAVGAER